MYYKILHLGNTSVLFMPFSAAIKPKVHGSLRSPLQVAISDCSPLWLKTCHRHVFLTRRARRERQKAPRIRSFLSRRKARVCDHCRSPFYRHYVIYIVHFLCRSRRQSNRRFTVRSAHPSMCFGRGSKVSASGCRCSTHRRCAGSPQRTAAAMSRGSQTPQGGAPEAV